MQLSSHSYSLQSLADFILATNYPSDTEHFVLAIDTALEKAFTLSYGVNDPKQCPPPSSNPPDQNFIPDRARLRSSKGGAAIRPLADRQLYLNSMCNVIPQLIDHKDATPFWPILKPIKTSSVQAHLTTPTAKPAGDNSSAQGAKQPPNSPANTIKAKRFTPPLSVKQTKLQTLKLRAASSTRPWSNLVLGSRKSTESFKTNDST